MISRATQPISIIPDDVEALPTREYLTRRASDPSRYNTDGESTRRTTQRIAVVES